MENKKKVSLNQKFSVLRGILPYFKPYRKPFILILIGDVFVNALFTGEPFLAKILIDYLSKTSRMPKPYSSDVFLPVIYLTIADTALWLSAGFGAYFVTMGLKKLGQYVIRDRRNDRFRKITDYSLSELRELKIGSYVTRITNDTQNLSTLFSDIVPEFLRSIGTILIITIGTFIVSGKNGCFYFGFIFLAFIPIVFFVSLFFTKQTKKYYRTNKKCISERNSFLSETFQGVKVIKVFSAEEKKKDEFDERNEAIRSSALKCSNVYSAFYPTRYLLQVICYVIIISIALPKVTRNPSMGGLTIGTFQMLISFNGQFFQPIQSVTKMLNQRQSIFSSAERVLCVLNSNAKEEEKEKGISVPSFKGKIEFKHVYFAYEGDDYVLKDISFVIQPGQTAAFVGATGAGKSTIISLINRTYEVNSGEILIDDVNIKNYSLDCIRKNIGVMLQEVFLFSGTISDNISLGDGKISQNEIVSASKEVGADSFIDKLPSKYQEKVKERGDNYSAGQRQLISFARTLVYKPSMVLLDEATANIDTETESIIQKSLEKMRSIGTRVIVAHRLSTIKNADIIFVIHKGHLREQGNHQELLKRHKIYYNLYQLQNRENNLGKGQTSHDQNENQSL